MMHGRFILPGAVTATLLCAALITFAAPQANTPAVDPKSAPNELVSRPWWSELTDAQRGALSPLAAEWNNMELFRKKKWLEIGNRFATMKPEEQQRMQERMRDWAKLTPDQRRVAREIYSRTNKLDSDQKSAQWLDYQQLPEEEKKKLAADTAAKKRVANLPSINTKPLDKAAVDKHSTGSLAAPASATTPAPLAVPAAPASPPPVTVK
jgi:hypothetical protein